MNRQAFKLNGMCSRKGENGTRMHLGAGSMKAPGARGRYGVFQTRLLVLLSNDDNHHLHRLSSSLIAHFPLVLAALIGHFPASGLCCSARKPLIRGSPSHDRTGQPRWGAQSLQVAAGERPFNSLIHPTD